MLCQPIFYLFYLAFQILLLQSKIDNKKLLFLFPLSIKTVLPSSKSYQQPNSVPLLLLPFCGSYLNELRLFLYLSTLGSTWLNLHMLTSIWILALISIGYYPFSHPCHHYSFFHTHCPGFSSTTLSSSLDKIHFNCTSLLRNIVLLFYEKFWLNFLTNWTFLQCEVRTNKPANPFIS